MIISEEGCHDVERTWYVEYECVEGGDTWGRKGQRTRIIFHEYDLQRFADTAPGGWEVRIVFPVERILFRD